MACLHIGLCNSDSYTSFGMDNKLPLFHTFKLILQTNNYLGQWEQLIPQFPWEIDLHIEWVY